MHGMIVKPPGSRRRPQVSDDPLDPRRPGPAGRSFGRLQNSSSPAPDHRRQRLSGIRRSTIAAAAAAASILPRRSSPTGATRKSRTCWPRSTRWSRAASPIRIDRGSAAGATAASSPITRSPAIRASRRRSSGAGSAQPALDVRHRRIHHAVQPRAGPAMEDTRSCGSSSPIRSSTPSASHADAVHGRRQGLQRAGDRRRADVPGAAARSGVPTQLIIYPDQNHELSRPSFLKDRYDRTAEWFGRYLQPNGKAGKAN